MRSAARMHARPRPCVLTRRLLSGMVVLMQASGVNEWFEPLLRPWVHYVPVASTLANLSDAVVWAREHQPEARAIARAAARLVEGALSERALAFYTGRLLHRFALLDAAHRPKQPKFHANAWVGIFRCRTAPSAVLECGFVAPGANETTRFSASMMALKP